MKAEISGQVKTPRFRRLHPLKPFLNWFKYFAKKFIRLIGSVSFKDIKNKMKAVNKLCRRNYINIVKVFKYRKLNTDSRIYFIDIELYNSTLSRYILREDVLYREYFTNEEKNWPVSV